MSEIHDSSYGLLKAIGEKYTTALGGIFVRIWNCYGKEKNKDKNHVINDFISEAMRTGRISMITNGREQRQFVHVDDCSRCLRHLGENFHTLDPSQSYHISGFVWTEILEVAKIIKRFLPHVEILPGHQTDLLQKDSRINPDRSILEHWSPCISLEDGIKKLIDGYAIDTR